MEDADRIHGFPEESLGATGVADGSEDDLIAVGRKPCGAGFQHGNVPIELGRVRQADKARHLRSRGRKIGGGVILKFGSLALDGSVQNLIRESGIESKEKVMGK